MNRFTDLFSMIQCLHALGFILIARSSHYIIDSELFCGEPWFGSLSSVLLICLAQRWSRPTVIRLHSNTNWRVSLRVSSNHLHSVLHYAVRNGARPVPNLCLSHHSQTVFHLKCREKKKPWSWVVYRGQSTDRVRISWERSHLILNHSSDLLIYMRTAIILCKRWHW